MLKKLFTVSVVTVTLAVSQIFTPLKANANGAYGHLYVGYRAMELLSNHTLSQSSLKNNLTEYKNGLVFPDALDAQIGNSFGHQDWFLTNYASWIYTNCYKKFGSWRGMHKDLFGNTVYDATCEKTFSHFMGTIGHVKTDALHDTHYIPAIEKVQPSFNKSCGNKRGCTMACDGSEPSDGTTKYITGCTRKPESFPGSQYFTDVLIDFLIATNKIPGQKHHPTTIKFSIPFMPTTAVGYALKSHDTYKKTGADAVMATKVANETSAIIGGSLLNYIPNYCPWAIEHHTDKNTAGSLESSAYELKDFFSEVIGIMVDGKKPHFCLKGTWAKTQRLTVTSKSSCN